jgi:TonB-dependent SusC/RagA subfamily outer membrane receptor
MSSIPAATYHLLACVTAALAAVLLLRLPLRSAFGPRIAYVVWALVPLAAIGALLPAPVAPSSSVIPKAVLPGGASLRLSIAQLPLSDAGPVLHRIDMGRWLIVCWIVGCSALILVQWYQQHTFFRRLGKLQHGDPGEWISEVDDVGPVVVGVFSPMIVLPADFHRRYTTQERALVLAHERMHLARRDPVANLAVAAVRSVFWFHPLVHLASRYFRIDQELACDAAVLEGRPHDRSRYAHALLKTQFGGQELAAGCCLASRTASSLKRRIIMLRTPVPGFWRRLLGATVVVLSGMASGSLAWALQTPQTPAIQTDSAVQGAKNDAAGLQFSSDAGGGILESPTGVVVRTQSVTRPAGVIATNGHDTAAVVFADSVPRFEPLPIAPMAYGVSADSPQPELRPAPDNGPIIIINGVRATTGVGLPNSIDPSTIQTFDVLKGPAAAAQYGPDAENGVIVVTTKKGQP